MVEAGGNEVARPGDGRPVENCYRVDEKLIAGEYPRTLEIESSKERLRSLLDAGVTLFVDLTEPEEPTRSGGPLRPYAGLLRELGDGRARHVRFAIRDGSVPSGPELVVAALDEIDAERARGGTVYVHCLGGIGRTGILVGCWLARHGHPGVRALARLRELWSANPKSRRARSPESAGQEEFVRGWRED